MELVGLLVFGLLIVISPGADFVLVFRNSLGFGRKAGLYTALGIGVGVCVHVTYSIVGISHFISHNDFLFSLVKYSGAGYLIYLGISSLKSSKLDLEGETDSPEKITMLGFFIKGLLCNLLNPKTMLFFLSVFSQLISSKSDIDVFVVFYGAYIAVLHGLWFACISFLVTSRYLDGILQRFGHRINQICGIGLTLFGLVLII